MAWHSVLRDRTVTGTMKTENLPAYEQLPSGKVIRRLFTADGSLHEEVHAYGTVDIGISYKYRDGIKIEETYLSKRRLVSRRSYEKARMSYADMPAPDLNQEDWGADLLKKIRTQQKERKLDRDRRFAESEESRFPRPASTNWLRVIAIDTNHLVVFASRDWKLLAREASIPSGRIWLRACGFEGTDRNRPKSGSVVARGLEIGYEVTASRADMLAASKALLDEVTQYAHHPPEVSRFQGSIRPRRRPRQAPIPVWITVLPPLIEFLSRLSQENVKIFNHHQ